MCPIKHNKKHARLNRRACFLLEIILDTLLIRFPKMV